MAMAGIQSMSFPQVPAPPLTRIRQHLSEEHIADVRGSVRQKLIDSGLLDKIRSSDRIAVTAGSRGMGGFTELLGGIIDAVKQKGGDPFIMPAMGSHGGAVETGQVEILHRLGVDETELGAPIRATMQTQALGEAKNGAIAHLDDIAAEADGIIVLGRTKTHPENREGIASGLLKMVTVGLGKQAGAQEAHSHGLWDSVREVPAVTMAKAKILCGVAVVENAYRRPVEFEVVPPRYEAFKDSDERLLKVAQPHVADLPFKQLDLLIVDEIGKDISGTGMDLNVIGSWRMNGGSREPDFRRIVVLSLTHGSLGNGLGIGLADFTTQRFVDEFDWDTTYVNLFTATEPGAMNSREGQLPLALPADRPAIEAALFSSLAPPEHPRVCRIRNTANLSEFWVSQALVEELEGNDKFSSEGSVEPLNYSEDGNLF
jgi:hypothetical protein